MSSNISSTIPSQTRTSTFSSSSVSSSIILSSVLLPMDPATSAFPSSDPLRPIPPPLASSSTVLLLSSSSSPPQSSSFSSPSTRTESSSVISSRRTFDIPSSTSLIVSSSTLPMGTTLSVSTSAVTSNRVALKPVEIMAIAFGVVTAILGIAAVLLICCFRPKLNRRRSLYNPKENKSSSSDLESRETPSGRSYFRSSHEQKGTITPLLQNSAPDTSGLSHDELYKDTELYDHVLFPVPIYGYPLQSSQLENPAYHLVMQNATSIRPPRSPPPPQTQDISRPFLSLTIPEFIAPELTIHPPKSPTQGPDSPLPRAYADESCDVDGDSPSIYSQPSVYVLSRGPSVSSHVSVRPFSVHPAVLESIIGGGSPIEENVGRGIDVGSEDGRKSSGETITPATRVPRPSFPNPHSPDPDSEWQQQQSYVNRAPGLDRQNTTAVISLLKSRQQRLELLPTVPSDVSHIERAGSIRPAFGGIDDVLGVGRMKEEKSGMGREPYGRRFRRMKAEQGNSGMAT